MKMIPHDSYIRVVGGNMRWSKGLKVWVLACVGLVLGLRLRVSGMRGLGFGISKLGIGLLIRDAPHVSTFGFLE